MAEPKFPPNRIKELRLARQLTVEQLGELAGTSHSTIVRLENRQRNLTNKYVGPLARALNVHPGELFEVLPANVDKPSAEDVREAIKTLKRAMAN